MMKLMIILLLAAQTLLLATFASSVDNGDFARTMSPKHLHKTEKLTHLRVFWHDISKGPRSSAVQIHKPVLNNTLFGLITIMDDALTTEMSMNSSVVGQAQGIYAAAAQGEIGYLMVMNFAFKTGKYNGSTIAILGRNVVLSKIREMPIVGGSGMFRFARGYVQAQTAFFDVQTSVAIVEYNCYILHY